MVKVDEIDFEMEVVDDLPQAESTTIMESTREELVQLSFSDSVDEELKNLINERDALKLENETLKDTSFNDSMHEEMQNLRNERDALKLENERLKNALRQSHLNSEIIKDDDSKSRFYLDKVSFIRSI